MSESIERKYALAKGLRAGDWLLPGNDGKTLWRLSDEDNSHNGDGWSVWRWSHPVGEGDSLPDLDAIEDWSRWDLEEVGHPTRGEAIQAALRAELPKPKSKHRHDPRPVGQILVDAYAKT
jgi:hypothetical protein